MIELKEPFVFDEFRNYIKVGDSVIIDSNPNGNPILKKVVVKNLRMNSIGTFEIKTKYGWVKPKFKVPYQDLNDFF